MGDYLGAKCPICEKKFAAGDDVVVCPICGTPYHRACYQKEGRCVNEGLHQSRAAWSQQEAQRQEEQKYDGSAPLRCSKCGTINPPSGIFCQICGCRLSDEAGPHSGASAQGPEPIPLTPFTTPYGGVAPDEEIEGVCVRDIALFVGENSHYFIPKFKAQFSGARAASWNWPAFLFDGFYFLYRKMYGLGAALVLLSVVISIPSVLFDLAVIFEATTALGLSVQALGWINRLRLAGSAASLLLRVFCAMTANRFYCKRALKVIGRVRAGFEDTYSQEYILTLTRKGRTNRTLIFVLLLGTFLFSMVLSLIMTMFVL